MESKHILIAEDEPHARLSLNILLKRAGYEVTAVPDGHNASNLLVTGEEKNKFDLLLTDIQMPNMNGLELIRHMKQEKVDVPVIVFTGFGDKETVVELLREGCEEYIDKPFSEDEALHRIKTVLDKSAIVKADKAAEEAHVHDLKRNVETYQMRFNGLNGSVDAAVEAYKDLLGHKTALSEQVNVALQAVTLDRLGGDYMAIYDNDNGADVFVADVAGHDMGASYHTVMLKAFFDENCRQQKDGLHFFQMLNWQLLNNEQNERMVTALHLRINLEEMWIETACAAHPYMLCLKNDGSGKISKPFSSLSGDVLGLLKNPSFESRRFEISEGDRLFIYTDGITACAKTDMHTGKKDRLCNHGLKDILSKHSNESLKDMLGDTWMEVREFCSYRHTDDMLLVGIEIPFKNNNQQ